MTETLRLVVADQDAGSRLDRFLSAHSGRPRNQVQRWIVDGRTTLNERAPKASTPVAAGDLVVCRLPAEVREPGLEPEPGGLSVLYHDADLVVIDKPAGIAVHPGAGRRTGTLAHFLLDRFPEIAEVGGAGRPGIVHRLDLGTTGVLAVARSERAYQVLAAAFAARQVEKTYLAVVYGTPSPAAGQVALPIGRDPRDRKRMAVNASGRPAVTHYHTVASAAGAALLRIGLETGRTHQIRVHAKALGHPLVGDPVYGEARWRGLPAPHRAVLRDFPRPALHAWRLAFAHPGDRRPLRFEAPVPDDLRTLWQRLAGTPWPADI